MRAHVPALSARRRTRARATRIVLAVLLLALAGQALLYAAVSHQMQAAATRAVPGGQVHLRPCLRPLGWDLLHRRLACSVLTAEQVPVPVGSRRIQVRQVRATIHDLGQAGPGVWRVGGVTGSADVAWDELGRLTGAAFSHGDGGVLRVTATMPVLHEPMAVTLEGDPRLDVDTQQLRIDNPSAVVGGVPVPPDLLTGVLAQVSARYPLPTIAGARWTSAQVSPDGVRLGFASDGLTVSGP